MISEHLAPTTALQVNCNTIAVTSKRKDESNIISFSKNNNYSHKRSSDNRKSLQFHQTTRRPSFDSISLPMTNQFSVRFAASTTATTTTTTTQHNTTQQAPTAVEALSHAVSAIAKPTKTIAEEIFDDRSSKIAQQSVGTKLIQKISATSPSATITTAATVQAAIAITSTITNSSVSAAIVPTPARSAHCRKNANCRSLPAQQKANNDANGRSAALERAYVHDVYENCEEPTGPIRPRIAQFLSNLDAGSVVCDVGCGSGRYLTQHNPSICTVGVDRCYRLSKDAKEKGGEVALCDNLELPFRDESFDAVLSVAVVHHFASTERRVGALRELARILRIGGRVVITVWALEQRHRRFESQDVLIPWQPPKNRYFSNSDEEEDEDFLQPYHAYTEDSTNSSRSAGDGDSSSLSSSSPGDSCYSFVRRAIQKLAGGRKHSWFLDSWTSKETKNDSSLDFEDARDLPIELRRLEDFEDITEPPLSAGLKSRSLGSILNPPPRQIVRSRSSVPILQADTNYNHSPQHAVGEHSNKFLNPDYVSGALMLQNIQSPTGCLGLVSRNGAMSMSSHRPKLIKQKQSLSDEDYQLPDNHFNAFGNYNCNSNSSINSTLNEYKQYQRTMISTRQTEQTNIFLRKQSSLNEELMAGNRIREKERVRKRIQRQMSLNEVFLCRSALFSKRLQVIREGFSTKIKTSTGSLERVTKCGISKIIQNIKGVQQTGRGDDTKRAQMTNADQANAPNHDCQQQQHHQQQPQHCHHHHHHVPHQGQDSLPQLLHKPLSLGSIIATKISGTAVSYCSIQHCSSANIACYCSSYHSPGGPNNVNTNEDQLQSKPRRHSHESGSDSSKDSSLQSDTSIESEDSFASVIFIPKPDNQHQQQQQLNYQNQHQNSNSSSSNSSSSNGGASNGANRANNNNSQTHQQNCIHYSHGQRCMSSVPTSPLVMPCPPTPAHSPAATQAIVTSPPQTMAAVTAAMSRLLSPTTIQSKCIEDSAANRFNFDEAHIKQQQEKQKEEEKEKESGQKPPGGNSTENNQDNNGKQPHTLQHPVAKITRQTIKELPPIPKFRKQQSLQLQRQFPIVRRSSAGGGAAPSIPKLLSLELFNPATDDLDSDSSEPSSPDSIDSVISAPKATANSNAIEEVQQQQSNSAKTENSDDAVVTDINPMKYPQQQQQLSNTANRPSNSNLLHQQDLNSSLQQTNCAAFAEQLSIHLQRQLDDKNSRVKCTSLNEIGDINEYLDNTLPSKKRTNGGEVRDMNTFREELRERRLMLANLSTQPSLQHSPASSSTSSLSSQTRSFTIHEEDEGLDEEGEEDNERSYSLQLYENCKISKFSYKHNRSYNLNAETAYLLQDDGDSSIRDDDDEVDDIEHDVILEEDEEGEANAEINCNDHLETYSNGYETSNRNSSRNTIKCNDGDNLDEIDNDNNNNECQERVIQDHSGRSTNAATGDREQHQQQQQIQQRSLQNRHSAESLENSNSSNTSLDSPSQGGSTTHHRYYHVFREGELDALINHHVANLHIVSSYYERASWCVVAEKVQVWTI